MKDFHSLSNSHRMVELKALPYAVYVGIPFHFIVNNLYLYIK